MPLSPGDRFDRYTIEGLLGQGGMGRVFVAYDTRLKRRVAVKVLRPGPDGESTGGQSRLLREAQAAAALDHPNVVAVFDVGELNGEPYIVMELVTGRSLRTYVSDRSIPIARKLGWLRDIAGALASAHARGLVHRDVKPSNVMVRDDGVVKVYDFGIARVDAATRTARVPAPGALAAEEEPEDTLSQTAAGTLVGTPRYMSPEQLRSETVDGRADQFAWGVLAYELLTGKMPWKSMAQDVDLVAAILLQPVDPPRLLLPALPLEAEQIVLRALAKGADERYPTMGEIVTALEPLISGSSRDLEAVATLSTSKLLAVVDNDETLIDTGGSKGSAGSGTKTSHVVIEPAPIAVKKSSGVLYGLIALGVVVAVSVIATVGYTTAAKRAHLGASSSSSSASSSASSHSMSALTDLPPPASSVPAAITAYTAGLQALRDGANRPATANFAKAIALDPQMAAAHMRFGLYTFYSSPTESREHLVAAQQRRNTLSPRDEAFLDALDPYIRRQPSDHDEYVKRLRAALVRFPGDAEMEMLIAYDRAGYESEAANALGGFDRALSFDPKFGMAFAYKAQEQAYRGDFVGGIATAETCVQSVPNATFCQHLISGMYEATGQCKALEESSRQAIALEPAGDTGYHSLAKALYAQDQTLDVVKVTLEQAWARPSEGVGLSFDPKMDTLLLHLLAGRFDLAEPIARELLAGAKTEATAAAHAKPSQVLIEILHETGQDAAAAEIASAYMRQRAAWTPDPRGEDFAVGRDPAPMMLATLRRAGMITPEAFAKERDAWVATWKNALLPMYARFAWLHGYAVPAAILETRDEARHAIDALSIPAFTDIPKFAPRTLGPALTGRAFLLAGDKNDDAVKWLQLGANSCAALDEPIIHTHAHLDLGFALEKAKDHDAACKAYSVVLSRWGHAKPKSVTAAKARERAKAIRCGATP